MNYAEIAQNPPWSTSKHDVSIERTKTSAAHVMIVTCLLVTPVFLFRVVSIIYAFSRASRQASFLAIWVLNALIFRSFLLPSSRGVDFLSPELPLLFPYCSPFVCHIFICPSLTINRTLLKSGIKHVISQSPQIAKLGRHLLFELIIKNVAGIYKWAFVWIIKFSLIWL